MRIRTIKPEFWESESLGDVSREARLLFIGLFSCCDDSGRTRAASRLLASRLFPYDVDAVKLLPKWLSELSEKGCVRIYTVDGETFLDIPKWLNHQKIDKPSPSKIPEFREDSRGFGKNSSGTGNREGEQGSGTGSREGGSVAPSASASSDENPPPPSPPGPVTKTSGQTDGEWMAELAADLAYAHVNINAEWSKMRRWCEANRKQPTRRRFINWINRIEQPSHGAANGGRTAAESARVASLLGYQEGL